MRQLFIILGCVFAVCQSYALEAQMTALEANVLYSKGQYEQAAVKYQSVVDAGYSSADLFFNLGNAYYKTKNIKSAILNYERAKLLSPGNKDIAYNLDMARSLTVDKIEPMPELFLVAWAKWVRNLVSADTWAILSIITFVFALASFLLYLLASIMSLKKLGFWLGVVFITFSINAYIMGAQLHSSLVNHKTAIVFNPSVTLKSSPSETGTNLFVLHEGAKVEILDQVGEWREIRIADGNRGWLKESDIEKI
jgi:tetratricopeptide (TPR) repeat protein